MGDSERIWRRKESGRSCVSVTRWRNFRRLSVEEQSKFDSIAASLKEEFAPLIVCRLLLCFPTCVGIALWSRLPLLATRLFASWHCHILILQTRLPPLSLGMFPSTVCIQVFKFPCSRSKNCVRNCYGFGAISQKATVSWWLGGAAISSSLADAHYDSAGPRHVGFPLASQSANQVSPVINQMSSFDSHLRPTIVSMSRTVNQTSDYFGMGSAVAESGVVQSFRRQESGRAKPARVRACYICGDPDHLRSACPFRWNCHRCLQPGHVARACPVRGESASSTAGGGQVANLVTEVHGLIMVSAFVHGIACPFLIDTGADVSVLPFSGTLCLLGATWPASQ